MKELKWYIIYVLLLTIFLAINKYTENTFMSDLSWFWVLSPIWGSILVVILAIGIVKWYDYVRNKELLKRNPPLKIKNNE